uniref:Secreted protein n=1 Tax=Macrostomum lignano TaxID=282301 RepID=A0A1I8GPI8_9PLAT
GRPLLLCWLLRGFKWWSQRLERAKRCHKDWRVRNHLQKVDKHDRNVARALQQCVLTWRLRLLWGAGWKSVPLQQLLRISGQSQRKRQNLRSSMAKLGVRSDLPEQKLLQDDQALDPHCGDQQDLVLAGRCPIRHGLPGPVQRHSRLPSRRFLQAAARLPPAGLL